jgi:hypothetical protein
MLSEIALSKQKASRAPQLPSWANEKDLPTAEMPAGPFDFLALNFEEKTVCGRNCLVAAISSDRLDNDLRGEAQRGDTKLTKHENFRA